MQCLSEPALAFGVTSDALAVLRDALALAEDERATLAAELLAGLPAPAGSDVVGSDEWLHDIERRASDGLAGKVQLEDWDIVEERTLGKLNGG